MPWFGSEEFKTFDHLENETISLHDLKTYLKKEKHDFMNTLIPLYSIKDTLRVNKRFYQLEDVKTLYAEGIEDQMKVIDKVQKFEKSIVEEEGFLTLKQYEKKKINFSRMKKDDFLRRFYNIDKDAEGRYYRITYDMNSLISLEEKMKRLGAEVSKCLFKGESLAYIVSDNNVNESDYFSQLHMRRYWHFRFNLFHKLKFYLKHVDTDFSQEFAQNALAMDGLNEYKENQKIEDINSGQTVSEVNVLQSNLSIRNSDKYVELDDILPDDPYANEHNENKMARRSSVDFDREEVLLNNELTKPKIIENPDIQTIMPEEDLKYYVLDDDEILQENEELLKKNLEIFKNNNIVKDTVLHDFNPILLTGELWFSVTPEDISAFIADYCYKKLSNNGTLKLKGIAMDITCGSGLDSIYLCKYWEKVLAVDINIDNLYSAFKNAQNYDVLDQLSFIHNDFNDPVFHNIFKKIYKGKVDFIYSSPPWCGPSYGELKVYDVDEHLGMDGLSSLLRKTLLLTNNCCFLLPKNASINQLISIARIHYRKSDPPVKIIYVSLDGKTKGLLALFGKKLTGN